MKRKKLKPPVLDAFFDMIKETKDEPDRGRVLVLTAWLDDALSQFMKVRTVGDPKVIESLFGPDRPLGTFSARINAAYAYAFISKGVYNDLHAIREVRNRFAHERTHLTLEDVSVRDICHGFDLIRKYRATEDKNDRFMTQASSEFLLAALLYTAYFIGESESRGNSTFMAMSEEQMLIHEHIPRFKSLYEQRNN